MGAQRNERRMSAQGQQIGPNIESAVVARSKGNGCYHDSASKVTHWERSVLGALLERPDLIDRAASLRPEDFVLDTHRKLFRAMKEVEGKRQPFDLITISATANEGDVGYLATLIHAGVVPENIGTYVRGMQKASAIRRAEAIIERLEAMVANSQTSDLTELRDSADNLVATLAAAESGNQDWRPIFHRYEEFEKAEPLTFAINGFLQEQGVTLIGGLPGHGKTLIMLAMTKALLEQSELFGYEGFTVPRPAHRVLYLVPESSLGPFWSRLQLFGLAEHVQSDRLFVRTLTMRDEISLDDPRLLNAAKGADIILDTAARFMDGSENDVEGTRPFAGILFRLLAAGARSITGAHHAPKGFETQEHMTLQNILRGSGDLGAMVCTAWGVRQIDAARNHLYMENIKPRDFQPCAPFVLAGRPHLDTDGNFKMLHRPGEADEMRSYVRSKGAGGGRPMTQGKDEKLSKAVQLRAQGVGVRAIAKAIGVGKSTVDRWLFDFDSSHNRGTGFRDAQEPGRGEAS